MQKPKERWCMDVSKQLLKKLCATVMINLHKNDSTEL